MLVNYDNESVGAKAWNRLGAVRDWATRPPAGHVRLGPPAASRRLSGLPTARATARALRARHRCPPGHSCRQTPSEAAAQLMR
jgi:hypothetical protein